MFVRNGVQQGCERLADPSAPAPTQRFQCLISLLLSSQTKDPVTATAIRNLQATEAGLTVQAMLHTVESRIDQLICKVSVPMCAITGGEGSDSVSCSRLGSTQQKLPTSKRLQRYAMNNGMMISQVLATGKLVQADNVHVRRFSRVFIGFAWNWAKDGIARPAAV